jgi:hypothetical protein
LIVSVALAGPAGSQQTSTEELKKSIDSLRERLRALQSEIQDVKGMLARQVRRPGDEAVPAPSRPAAPVVTKTFEPEIAETLVRILAAAPERSPVWIAAPASDLRAVSRAEDFARIFRSAGWSVRAVTKSTISIRPGTYLFAADAEPPAYIDTIRQALEQAGLSPTVANGYRQYYDEKVRSDRNFRGFPFAPDQTFLLVVGRLP